MKRFTGAKDRDERPPLHYSTRAFGTFGLNKRIKKLMPQAHAYQCPSLLIKRYKFVLNGHRTIDATLPFNKTGLSTIDNTYVINNIELYYMEFNINTATNPQCPLSVTNLFFCYSVPWTPQPLQRHIYTANLRHPAPGQFTKLLLK